MKRLHIHVGSATSPVDASIRRCSAAAECGEGLLRKMMLERPRSILPFARQACPQGIELRHPSGTAPSCRGLGRLTSGPAGAGEGAPPAADAKSDQTCVRPDGVIWEPSTTTARRPHATAGVDAIDTGPGPPDAAARRHGPAAHVLPPMHGHFRPLDPRGALSREAGALPLLFGGPLPKCEVHPIALRFWRKGFPPKPFSRKLGQFPGRISRLDLI